MWLLETLIYVACMPAQYSSVDRASFYVFYIYCCKIAFHIYIYIIFGINCSGQCCVGFVLLTLSHKSPVVRPSIAQRADGWYRLKLRAYGLTSCALPLFGGSRSRWLTHIQVYMASQLV